MTDLTPDQQKDITALYPRYAALQIQASPYRQHALLTLVRAWLLRYTHTRRLPLTVYDVKTDVLLDDAALAFILTFGRRLWPASRSARGHLQQDAFLRFERDFLPEEGGGFGRGEVRDLYRGRFEVNGGREAVRAYFEGVNGRAYEASGEGEGDLDELFGEVVRP